MSDMDPSKPWAWSWRISDPGVLPKFFRQTTEHGQCGCCSMVVASAACSAAYAIKTARPPLDLAIQELINKVPKYYWDEMTVNENDLCASAYTSTSFKYIKSYTKVKRGSLLVNVKGWRTKNLVNVKNVHNLQYSSLVLAYKWGVWGNENP
ncbi:hypothetical protein RHMOL_Rhmol10G0297000 [Rhododendron molle]|uniref:Uncharacterized protein n=1 Tax=Rhododendron molle TaxID=49168 RepID=A0ACC0M9F0_RHOML|nr:hypothetical protein RHMOL_Rhmol10G0297000 [Rhododendron molle]